MNGISFADFWERFQAEQALLARARKLSTEELKAIWDAYDGDAEKGQKGYFWPDDGPHIEEVHRVLNERGEGSYCAV